MSRRALSVDLAPLSSDVETAVRLAREAIEAACRQAVPPVDPGPRSAHVGERIRAGTVDGRLYRVGGNGVGLVLWDDEGYSAAGHHVHLFHLSAPFASEAEYGRFVDRFRSEVGPIVFLPAGLSGLTPEEEARVVTARQFAAFARSEMRLPPTVPVPELQVPGGIRVRPMRADDEPAAAAVHAAAFGPHFEFYLYQRSSDPKRSSELEVHDMMAGRWGEFLPWASFLAESEDRHPWGVCLFVRASYGPLLINLAVDPRAQGRGVGRALTVAALRALRERAETVVALNVTEGNRRAIALYEGLGFVRSIGPEASWFSVELVPVLPDGSPSRPSPSPEPGRSGSPDDAGRQSPPA